MSATSSNGNAELVSEVVLVSGLCAELIDERLRATCRLADVGHRATAFYLADMHERGLHQALGRPTTVAYAVDELGMSRRQARELLQAGVRLRELRVIDAAFAESRLSWSRVRRLCEVATPETEQAWLDRALISSQGELDRLVQRTRRGDAPPVGEGLPRPQFALHLQLDAVKWQLWENARAKLRDELGVGGCDDVRDEDLLLEMLQLVLRTDREGNVPGRKGVDGSLYRVMIQEPTEGGHGAVLTEEGREPIDERILESAVSDGATSPALRAKVFARDGHACKNCGSRRALHAHHVVWRSHGGATTIDNLVTACARCHGLVHEGFLDVDVAHGADSARTGTAFVFRNCHGRLLGGRAVGGTRIVMPLAQMAQPAQCATAADAAAADGLPAKVDAKWLMANIDRFDARGGKFVVKAKWRAAVERELGALAGP